MLSGACERYPFYDRCEKRLDDLDEKHEVTRMHGPACGWERRHGSI